MPGYKAIYILTTNGTNNNTNSLIIIFIMIYEIIFLHALLMLIAC